MNIVKAHIEWIPVCGLYTATLGKFILRAWDSGHWFVLTEEEGVVWSGLQAQGKDLAEAKQRAVAAALNQMTIKQRKAIRA